MIAKVREGRFTVFVWDWWALCFVFICAISFG